MVMKDKLEKFGHKRGYYYAKETFIGFMAAVSVFAIVAIPTYIASNSSNTLNLKDEQKDDQTDTDNYLSVDDDK